MVKYNNSIQIIHLFAENTYIVVGWGVTHHKQHGEEGGQGRENKSSGLRAGTPVFFGPILNFFRTYFNFFPFFKIFKF